VASGPGPPESGTHDHADHREEEHAEGLEYQAGDVLLVT